MNKKIDIPFLNGIDKQMPMEMISVWLDSLQRYAIDQEPWPQYKSNSKASFSIAHCGEAILLKYYVQEDYIKSAMHRTNDPVHKDNCVEFFISAEAGNAYYNIEINCFGICLMGYREEGKEREFLPVDVIGGIRRSAVMKSMLTDAVNKYEWQLTMVIPVDVFIFSKLPSLRHQQLKGNFYKCGDELPDPHYLSWNMIVNDRPDFHLPAFFGSLNFE